MRQKEGTYVRDQMYKLPLVLEPQPGGGYTVTSPVVPELITEADTLDQVIPNALDALTALTWPPAISSRGQHGGDVYV